MFGRELSEQVIADKLAVPVVVTKCIGAVEVVGEWKRAHLSPRS
jgi:hypothetical protein